VSGPARYTTNGEDRRVKVERDSHHVIGRR
jgi:hypothetical protein